jgi:hypothetical protein
MGRSARRKWICKSCGHAFSVTAGTNLADRKMSFGKLLPAIFLFVNAIKDLPAVQLSREVGCGKVAFVLPRKLRGCLKAEQARHLLGGKSTECETDTACFRGHGKLAGHQADGETKGFWLQHHDAVEKAAGSHGVFPSRFLGTGFSVSPKLCRSRGTSARFPPLATALIASSGASRTALVISASARTTHRPRPACHRRLRRPAP